jgi:predicted dehydrogenase
MVVGLVGCGRWGRYILRDLLALGCDVPVVARTEESIRRAREGGATEILEETASLAGVDGIVVATPTSTHADLVEEGLAHGVPVFCEKPLTDDESSAAALARLAPERLFVMDKWRYHPGVLALGRIARERSLGPVSGIRTTRVGWGSPHDDVDPIWVLAPHDLSIALEITGEVPRPRAAVAQSIGGRLVDLTGLLGGDGWWHALEVSARSAERTRRIELHCEEGVAVLGGGWEEHISVFRDGSERPEEARIETPGELPLLAELRAFVGHLAGGAPPRSSAFEGAAIVTAIARLRALATKP